jgi:sec-independent protein translocase protein TatB
MFDIGASELLLIVVVAVVVIGPKDLPLAMRTAGRWIAKVRRVSGHFRSGIDAMVREAEMEELEREWKARNEAIMKAHPDGETHPMPAPASAEGAAAQSTPGEADAPPPPP